MCVYVQWIVGGVRVSGRISGLVGAEDHRDQGEASGWWKIVE